MDLNGVSAIITGGASGIGGGTARILTAAGARCALLDRNLDLAAELAAELGGVAVQCDVGDHDSLGKAIAEANKKIGTARVMVNAAGIDTVRKIASGDGPHAYGPLQRVINVNLVGVLMGSAYAANDMMALDPLDDDGERGVIVNIASVAAFNAPPGQAAYAASKAGVVGATLPMARDLAQYGIRVMCIAPGLFETPLSDTISDSVKESMMRNIPFPKRMGKPQEIGELIKSICENRMLNAETIRIHAGWN